MLRNKKRKKSKNNLAKLFRNASTRRLLHEEKPMTVAEVSVALLLLFIFVLSVGVFLFFLFFCTFSWVQFPFLSYSVI